MKNVLSRSQSLIQASIAATSSIALLFAPVTAFAAGVVRYPSGNGTYQQWSSSGGSHWQAVNEITCNGTTDYIYYPSTATSDVKDSFTLDISAIPNGSTITSITITPCASRHDTDTSTSTILNVFYRLNGNNSSLKKDYVLSGTTPTILSSSTWNVSITKTAGTTLESGVSFWGGAAGARVSNLRTVIHYE